MPRASQSHVAPPGIIPGPMPPIAISKTKLLRYLQCPKRLWLEQYSPELEDEDAYDQAAIETGRVVGEKAREIFGNGAGQLIDHNRGLRSAVAETAALLMKISNWCSMPGFRLNVRQWVLK